MVCHLGETPSKSDLDRISDRGFSVVTKTVGTLPFLGFLDRVVRRVVGFWLSLSMSGEN